MIIPPFEAKCSTVAYYLEISLQRLGLRVVGVVQDKISNNQSEVQEPPARPAGRYGVSCGSILLPFNLYFEKRVEVVVRLLRRVEKDILLAPVAGGLGVHDAEHSLGDESG
ncbi:hypothetical protein SAMD00023353_0100530 [Rosellinia necatrix]|uniref:Uncharacterized protein n=1 Tax=Rosellinia necatrix TaxID=77044 RepID=A0A1S8A4K2_ROSNE|nr:hypothetical protein SAMD00023353_0100530 [Rosellinia necatrix]